MKANIRLTIYKLIPSLLLTLLRNVIEKFTGNTALPNPPVSLPDMIKAGDDLEKFIEEAFQGSRLSREKRDSQVMVVRSILTQTGNYVRTTANGNAIILAGSGFEMAKTPQPVSLPGAPKNLRVKMGPLTGQTISKWRREPGATSYVVLRCDTDPSVLENFKIVATTSKVTFVDSDLVSFKAYWYRVSAVGFAGQGEPCSVEMGRAA